MAKRNAKGQFAKGTTGNPKGRPRKDAKPRGLELERVDGWQSMLTGVGTTQLDKRQHTYFEADVLDYGTQVSLMRGDDTASRAVEKLPETAASAGFDVKISDDNALETQEVIEQHWQDLHALECLTRIACYERAFGGGAAIIGANDGQDLRTPLNLEAVQSVDFLTPLEPRECCAIWYYDDPLAPNYRKPSIYQVTPISEGVSEAGNALGWQPFEIHESRLLIMPGIRVNAESHNNGWGDSMLNRLWRILRDFNMAWDATGVLMSDFSQSIFKIKDLAVMLANDDGDTFRNRLKALELGRSVVRAAVLDSEEEFERKATPMSGLPEVLDRFESRVAAATDMPITVLFGRSPAGLNATGESDMQMWDRSVAQYRDRKMIPALSKLTKILLAAEGKDPDQWSVEGRPLAEETERERAEVRKIDAETAQILINTGVVYPEEVATSMFGGDVYQGQIMVDFEEREKLEAELEEKAKEAAEQFAQNNPDDEDQPAPPDDEEGAEADDPPPPGEGSDDEEVAEEEDEQ